MTQRPPRCSSSALEPISYKAISLSEAAQLKNKGRLSFDERIQKALFAPNKPPGLARTQLSSDVVGRHDTALQRDAGVEMPGLSTQILNSLPHTPTAYMNTTIGPAIVDYCQPIAEMGGRCEREGREFIARKLPMAVSWTSRTFMIYRQRTDL